VRDGDVQRLEVEIGRTGADAARSHGTLHLSWREASTASRPAAPEYREAYLWTFRPRQSDLHGIVQYEFGQASLDELSLDLPQDVALRRVEATRLADGAPIRLKRTEVTQAAGKSRLRLLLQNAVSGGAQIAFELLPLKPFGERASLSLPMPHGTPAKEGGLLAYRLEGLDAKVVDNLFVTSI